MKWHMKRLVSMTLGIFHSRVTAVKEPDSYVSKSNESDVIVKSVAEVTAEEPLLSKQLK